MAVVARFTTQKGRDGSMGWYPSGNPVVETCYYRTREAADNAAKKFKARQTDPNDETLYDVSIVSITWQEDVELQQQKEEEEKQQAKEKLRQWGQSLSEKEKKMLSDVVKFQ